MAKDEDTNWDYQPDDDQNDPKKSVRSIKWTASEYIDHQRGGGWYLGLIAGTAVLAVAIYFLAHDYFAVGVIIALGVIVGLYAKKTPRNLEYELSADGLSIAGKLYPLSQFRSFSIIQEGPISSIDFIPLKRLMPLVSVYFETANQDKITSLLENYLPYEERSLDSVDRLSRRLRF